MSVRSAFGWPSYSPPVAEKKPVHPLVAAARAQKAAGVTYTQAYYPLSYPNGDPPKDRGACADVVVRALRTQGIDLQKEIHVDAKKHVYPRIGSTESLDKNIDHRRVPNQITWLSRHAKSLPLEFNAKTKDTFQPGDIVMWSIKGGIADHVGIVTDRPGVSGNPAVIHHYGDFLESDDLASWRIVGHFRIKPRSLPLR